MSVADTAEETAGFPEDPGLSSAAEAGPKWLMRLVLVTDESRGLAPV